MRTRLLIVSAAIVALATPTVQAGGITGFLGCGSGKNSQCAVQFVTGNKNIARIDQTSSKKRSIQLGIAYQQGNGNRSYIGQKGGNQVALTVQTGNNNASYVHQDGEYQASVVVQSGNGNWAGVSSISTTTDPTLAIVAQSN